jgi:hypothetical protein
MKPRYRRVPYRPDEEEWVRAPEAGRRLEIHTREVFELVDAGVIRIAVDAKGHAWVPVADVEAYLKRRSA